MLVQTLFLKTWDQLLSYEAAYQSFYQQFPPYIQDAQLLYRELPKPLPDWLNSDGHPEGAVGFSLVVEIPFSLLQLFVHTIPFLFPKIKGEPQRVLLYQFNGYLAITCLVAHFHHIFIGNFTQ
jgi:hypothetical protein